MYESGEVQNMDKKWRISILFHSMVDEKDPFALYAIEIETEYSITIINKTKNHFQNLQYNLGRHNPNVNKLGKSIMGFIEFYLAKFYIHNCCQYEDTEWRKRRYEVYCRELLKLCPDPRAQIKINPFIETIYNFFKIKWILRRENQNALKIQKFWKCTKNRKKIKTVFRTYFKEKGWICNIEELPDEILILILSYLKISEKLALVPRLSRTMNRISHHPSLWTHIDLSAYPKALTSQILRKLLELGKHVEKLNLSYSPSLSLDLANVLSSNMNSVSLESLSLDGCEQVTDQWMSFFTSNMSLNPQKYPILGLQILSLVECRSLTDAGAESIIHFKDLRILNLLGCFSLTDEGVSSIARGLLYLEDVNLGGTSITRVSLRELIESCLNIRNIQIKGCKKCNQDDAEYLQLNNIGVEAGDDVFKFYLQPHMFTELPKVTNSVLKTRSTLSAYRVQKYALRKLNMQSQFRGHKLREEDIQILCRGKHLNPEWKLILIYEQIFDTDGILQLTYRKRNEEFQLTELRNVKYKGPPRPPLWIPNHLAYNCMNPLCARSFGLFTRIHHCRNCGKCFCSMCNIVETPLLKFGYLTPVRVCVLCAQNLAHQFNTHMKDT